MAALVDIPGQVPAPPYGMELNTAMQTAATLILWIGTAGLLLYAVKMARSEKSWFPIILVVAVATGSIVEPIYDITYHLHWLDNGEQWTLFTSFGLPQPVWVMPAYVMVFGLPALLLYRVLAKGTSMKTIFLLAGLTSLTTTIFEITAVNTHLYTYYGESPWRVFHYPLFIGFMEGSQITGFAVLATCLAMTGTKQVHALALFALFPANFAYDTIGAGFPTLVLQNSTNPNGFLLFLSAFVSVALTATCLWWSSQLLLMLQRKEGLIPENESAREPVAV